ncbi:hypothetical protein FEM48_Zijuj08G0069500 [Ziziphus jujuba var. spinosa]|uniref:mannan endo-1,4-beta-mannosidase n=1 Tax=Ziziphus jujuba var. spinosa TaxID=714518 RepID=A0A978UXM6_ZIZJJ|nr:hypothetical protein FEM48_Zijuj08G0069500 [Ziziphus jujuba var. spinosa]
MTFFRKISYLLVLLLFVPLVCEAEVPRISGFVETRDNEFFINGSGRFLFNGFNSYWMMTIAADPNQRYKITNVFREASATGLTVCRTWAFADGGYGALQIAPGIYNEDVFQALDFVIAEANKYAVRLIMSLVNEWKDYGGKHQYVEWAKINGANISSDDDFYTNPLTKTYYKNHVKRVLTRVNSITRIAYKDDPTIMAWELMNEPRDQVDYTGKTVTAWTQEMASYAKSLDSKHLVEIGTEGFYGSSTPERLEFNPGNYQYGTDFITINQIKDIDFTTIHAYPDMWFPGENESEQVAFAQRWLFSHWLDSNSILKKPLAITEFGKSKKQPGYTVTMRDSYLNTIFTDIYDLASNYGGMAGSCVWQVLSENMQNYNDGYGIVLSQDTLTRDVLFQQSKSMRSLEHKFVDQHGPNY